ncbi:hypothetical protein Clacol_007902 [Clathrus columnatus]|uniref:Uncharacterized protein n=1 Tax=Clathrus columnatus TaxID=1419009 RepID=A0AAV5AL35_9AGAM|nr:hypothetical protein Clacol_007902 [Clathrus columnatus]
MQQKLPTAEEYLESLEEWSHLTSAVYQWLKQTIKEHESDEWHWGVNFFWICYLGAAPFFPVALNPSVNWDPDIIPIASEFVNNRTKHLALSDYVPCGGGEKLFAWLVEWLHQRELWILHSVDVKEFQCRVIANGL